MRSSVVFASRAEQAAGSSRIFQRAGAGLRAPPGEPFVCKSGTTYSTERNDEAKGREAT